MILARRYELAKIRLERLIDKGIGLQNPKESGFRFDYRELLAWNGKPEIEGAASPAHYFRNARMDLITMTYPSGKGAERVATLNLFYYPGAKGAVSIRSTYAFILNREGPVPIHVYQSMRPRTEEPWGPPFNQQSVEAGLNDLRTLEDIFHHMNIRLSWKDYLAMVRQSPRLIRPG